MAWVDKRADIPVKAYRAYELRVLLMNPTINVNDGMAMRDAVPMHYKAFSDLKIKRLNGKIPKEEWFNKQILNEEVVRLILEPYKRRKQNGKGK